MTLFKRGDKIIIRDKDSFYFGREAEVISETDWLNVWNVKVNDIYFGINKREMELVR